MMTSNDTVTVLLCGVGGQGTILAADLLAHAALESGTVAAFPQMRHLMDQDVFQELRFHQSQLKVQTDAAGSRCTRSPARGHDP